jgi:hypothetical protein
VNICDNIAAPCSALNSSIGIHITACVQGRRKHQKAIFYRPPNNNSSFIDEFDTFLSNTSGLPKTKQLLYLGISTLLIFAGWKMMYRLHQTSLHFVKY